MLLLHYIQAEQAEQDQYIFIFILYLFENSTVVVYNNTNMHNIQYLFSLLRSSFFELRSHFYIDKQLSQATNYFVKKDL